MTDTHPGYPDRVTVDDVIRASAQHFMIRVGDIKGRKRTKSMAVPRFVACYVARKLTRCSYPEIGAALGRDHTSVLHAVQQVEARMESDLRLANAVRRVTEIAIEYVVRKEVGRG